MGKQSYYLKKIGQRGKIKIWLVDGAAIRRDLDPEFPNFGQHFRFNFIPEYEFWIDREAVPDERRFFIDHLLTEWRLMKKGVSYSEATDIADTKERSERIKSLDFRKILDKKGQPDVAKFHLRLLEKTPDGVSVWLVDGKLVRTIFDVEFTEGGHDLIYDFVPKNEVWIDNDVEEEERKFVILHETYERELMKKGMLYPQAHKKASRVEWQARQADLL